MSLPTASFVPVAPPAEGLQLAFRGARRRRQRKAATASSAGLAAVVALLLTLGGTAGDQTLMQEQLPPARGGVPLPLGPAGASAAPAPLDQPAAATDRTTVTGRDGSSSAAAPLAAGAAATPAAAGRSGRTGGRPAPGASAPVSGPMTRTGNVQFPSDLTCPVQKRQEGVRSLCTFLYATGSAPNVDLQAGICSTETSNVDLTYATTMEVDMVVSAAKGGELWRWSEGHSFEANHHTVTVGPGDCMTWTTTWRSVDQQGRRLPAGEYTVMAQFTAAELPQADQVAKSTYTVR